MNINLKFFRSLLFEFHYRFMNKVISRGKEKPISKGQTAEQCPEGHRKPLKDGMGLGHWHMTEVYMRWWMC